MKKIITLSGKEYSLKSSAFTQFKYKNETGRKLLEDIQQLATLQGDNQEEALSSVDDLLEILLRLTYIMIEEADASQVTTYENFLKDIDGIFDDPKWLEEVVELATSPICRGIQTTPQKSD